VQEPVTPPIEPGPPPGETVAEEVSAELLARLRNGDAAALTELFHTFGTRIYNTCRRIVGSDADAEDATQEVFLRVLTQAAKFDGRSRFGTWLFRLAVNHTINLSRKNRRRAGCDLDQVELPTDTQPTPLESVLQREERRHLDEALQSLPADQRAILILREIEGLTYAEIGGILDLPPGTVTSRLVRGRERLAEMLRRRLDPPNLNS
jgi:RNA polymerase sigma-70 factor, ECF subfamily